ncbi:MAG: tetratricopeptide repeat protein [Calditrichaeota bacterium]|nr:tetratricopeptide repeat protein [Calditrichota bacterium]
MKRIKIFHFFIGIFFIFLLSVAHGQYARKIRLVILPFDFTGASFGRELSWVQQGVPDQISAAFHRYYRNRIRLVERERLNNLLQEQQLSQAGFVDANQIVEVGKFFSANFSLAGNIVCPDENHLMISVKIIDIETSEYVSVTHLTDAEQGIFTIGDSLAQKIYPELLRFQQEKRTRHDVQMADKIEPTSTVAPGAETTEDNFTGKNVQLISAVSKAATSHFYNAVNWIRQSQWGKAEVELLRSVELDSGFARAYANLGTVYMNMGKFSAARRALQKCLQVFPESELAYHNLGLLEANRRDYPSALVYFQRGLQINTDDLELMTEVGKVYIELDSLSQADRIFNDVLWDDSSYVEAEFYLGLTAAKRHDLISAEKHWQRVARTQEPYFQFVRRMAFLRLGDLYQNSYKEPKQAIRFYEQALMQSDNRMDQSDVRHLFLPLAKLYMQTDQAVKACDLLTQVLDFDASNLEARYYYAIALWRSGQKDNAIVELQTITRTAPPGQILELAKQQLKRFRGY